MAYALCPRAQAATAAAGAAVPAAPSSCPRRHSRLEAASAPFSSFSSCRARAPWQSQLSGNGRRRAGVAASRRPAGLGAVAAAAGAGSGSGARVAATASSPLPATASPAAAARSAAGGVDAAYLACAQALRALGFQNAADIARVLDTSMNPNSLFTGRGGGSGRKGANAAAARENLTAEEIAAVAAFLSARVGLSSAEVVAVVGAHPGCLCYSVPNRPEPWAQCLQEEAGVGDLRAAVLARPSLLGLDANASLRKIVEYLRSVGTAPEDIAIYVTKSI